MKRRVLHVLIAIDQLLWVLLTLGKGHPDETISAAAWRMEQQGKIAGKLLRPLIDAVFWAIEKEHCKKSWLAEKYRQQLPPSYQEGVYS